MNVAATVTCGVIPSIVFPITSPYLPDKGVSPSMTRTRFRFLKPQSFSTTCVTTMRSMLLRSVAILSFVVTAATPTLAAKVVIFYEKDFPTVENGAIKKAALSQAFSSLSPRFVDLDELEQLTSIADGDLLILPYGSAIPADAWGTLQQFIDHGNILVIGGRPLFVPVNRVDGGWHVGSPQNTYSQHLGISHSYAAPQHGPWRFQADINTPWVNAKDINPRRVFVNAGFSGGYHGIGFLIDHKGNRVAAPIVAEDVVRQNAPSHRRVYLSFDSESEYWESLSGVALMRQAAEYASHGGVRIWLNIQQLAMDPGDHVTGTIEVERTGLPARVTIELLSDQTLIARRTEECGNSLFEEINLPVALREPGLYTLRATVSSADSLFDRYTTGFWVRDSMLLRSGPRLEAGRDYLRLNDKPYLMVGTNYFSTDRYTYDFFLAASLGGNAWSWDRDFAEMEQQGFTAVRTGIWLNRARYLDLANGHMEDRALRAIEAFLCSAARHHIQVVFTLFAFNPQMEMEQGPGQVGDRLGPGSDPYIDPVAIEAQTAYVRSIASRFRDVPCLSYDLINEPSFDNPKRTWMGNSPNGDPKELAAWQQWLERRYGTVEKLALAWRTIPGELGAFSRVPVPAFADMEHARAGNAKSVRVIDFNLFAQDAFVQWADTIIHAIRSTGAQQIATIGQDEGGVADRVLNQFWAGSQVAYTVNHTWWRDDALLWSSVAAKTPMKPNLIGETGPQPVGSMDGSWRLDELGGYSLEERKLALGFAAANTGALHWEWTRQDTYGLLRRDGSCKQWMDALQGIARFAHDAQPYAIEAQKPDIALVLPQALQLSVFGSWGVTSQQNAVRILYHRARAAAFAIGEYQLAQMHDAKLIIVPSPWVMHQEAWDLLMQKAKAGATLLISGRIDADEHWIPVPERTRDWSLKYAPARLTAREAVIQWPEGSATLTYSGDRTTFAECGSLDSGKTFLEIPLGSGRILYFTDPLELADQYGDVGRIYKYAMKRAGTKSAYETSCDDPGILICPTQLPEATLYVLTSESSVKNLVAFKDARSGRDFHVSLDQGRAALLLVAHDGKILASYNCNTQ